MVEEDAGPIDSALVHQDLYYLNQYKLKSWSHERVTIMYDKMDHSKTASLVLSHKVKHLDGLIKLLLLAYLHMVM